MRPSWETKDDDELVPLLGLIPRYLRGSMLFLCLPRWPHQWIANNHGELALYVRTFPGNADEFGRLILNGLLLLHKQLECKDYGPTTRVQVPPQERLCPL